MHKPRWVADMVLHSSAFVSIPCAPFVVLPSPTLDGIVLKLSTAVFTFLGVIAVLDAFKLLDAGLHRRLSVLL